jgi:hypothetical protein
LEENMAVTLGLSALISDVTLIVSQGADNHYHFRWSKEDAAGVITPVDLSLYTGRAQMRAAVGTAIWVELTTPTGIVVDALGNITIHLDDALTEVVEWNDYKAGVWDIELESPAGEVTRFAEGTVTVSPDVTRDTVTPGARAPRERRTTIPRR